MSTTHPTNIDIAAALAEAQELYGARNPKSLAQYEAACAALPGGNTRSAIFVDPFPLTMAKGEGAHLWDLDGLFQRSAHPGVVIPRLIDGEQAKMALRRNGLC